MKSFKNVNGPTALGIHVFMGGMTRGVIESLQVKEQLEVFNLGELTVPDNLGIPFTQLPFESWREHVAGKQFDVVYGNPRCTGFSALGHGCSEDAHGAWSNPTIDIRQLAECASWLKPKIWGFESVQQAGTVGRDLIEWLHATYGAGYRLFELYHNAAQFGSCQHRRRVIFLWVSTELPSLPINEVTEEHLYRGPHRTVGDVLSPYYDQSAVELTELYSDARERTWVCERSPFHSVTGERVLQHYYRPTADVYVRAAIKANMPMGRSLNSVPARMLDELGEPSMALNRRLGVSFSWHAPRKLHVERSCPVVYSASGKFIHPTQNRPLTIRELSALMGFDDDWVVLGDDPIAQLGKGLCVQVGRWLGDLCNAALTGRVKSNEVYDGDHFVVRLDRELGLVPKRPRISPGEYLGYEGEDD